MDLKAAWREALNSCVVSGAMEGRGDGWLCVRHEEPGLDPLCLGFALEHGRVFRVARFPPGEMPDPSGFRSVAEAWAAFGDAGVALPLFAGLRWLSPLPGWRDHGLEGAVTLPARIVEGFKRAVRAEDPVLAARLPVADLRTAARAHLLGGVSARLVERLDLDVLGQLQWADTLSRDARVFDWYGGWRDAAMDVPEALARRRQALKAAPFFAGVLAVDHRARQAVDEGRPLFATLADIFAVPPALISAVAGLRVPSLWSDVSPFRSVMEALGTIPVDWLKATRGRDDLLALGTLLRLECQAREQGFPAGLFLGGAKGKWSEALKRLAKAGADRRPPEGIVEEEYRLLVDRLPLAEIAAVPRDDRPVVAAFHARRLVEASSSGPVDGIADWAARISEPDARPAAMDDLFAGMRSMALGFASRILLPTVLRETGLRGRRLSLDLLVEVERAAGEMLFAGKSGARVMKMTRAFLNNEPRLLAADPEIMREMAELATTPASEWLPTAEEERRFGLTGASGASWPAVTRPVIAPNGLAVVPLTSHGHLVAEGRGWNGDGMNPDGSQGLAICVGTHGYYLANCLSGGAQILSVREIPRDGSPVRRVSCVELRVKSPDELVNVQHRGRSNGSPPAAAQEAVQWWLDNLGRSPELPINPHWRVFVRNAGLRGNFDQARVICGHDWRHAPGTLRVLSAWREVLGGEVPGHEEILGHPVFREVVARHGQDVDAAVTAFRP